MFFFEKIVSQDGIAVYPGLQSREKAIEKLSLLLEKQLSANEVSCRELYEMALEREHVGSTSVGHGIAFAHCNSDCFKHLYAVIGIFPEGIHSWDTPDDEPVHILFLIASPTVEACRYFAFISHVSRMLRSRELAMAIISSSDPAYIYDFFAGWEKKYGNGQSTCQR